MYLWMAIDSLVIIIMYIAIIIITPIILKMMYLAIAVLLTINHFFSFYKNSCGMLINISVKKVVETIQFQCQCFNDNISQSHGYPYW